MAMLDVTASRQVYLGLPDGQLWQHEAEIAEQLIALALMHNITRFLTLGRSGYDEHPDHITTHLAAETAARTLRSRHEHGMGVLALSATHNGNHRIAAHTASRQRKLGAIASHQSQFPISIASGKSDGDVVQLDGYEVESGFWNSFSTYHTLILHGETYELMS